MEEIGMTSYYWIIIKGKSSFSWNWENRGDDLAWKGFFPLKN